MCKCRSGKLSSVCFSASSLSLSLSGAFCRLAAHTIGFCVHGLRNAVRWQGSGIAVGWGRGVGGWGRVRPEGGEGPKGRQKGRHGKDRWRVVMRGGWPPTTVPGAQRLQGSTGCPGFCTATRAYERLRSSVYTQPGNRKVANIHLHKKLAPAYILGF